MIDWQRRALAAEKTVEVLTRKVKAFYHGEKASTFERQLERADKRRESALRKSELVELRAQELKRYSESLEQTVAERTRALTTILDNVACGFLVVGPDQRVREGYTLSCHQLLGTEHVAGRDILELLCVDPHKSEWVRMALEQVNDGLLPDDVSLGQLPQRYPVYHRVLRIDARALRDQHEQLEGILFTLTDVTSLEQAERDARNNQALIGILKQREPFASFVAETRASLASAREGARSNQAFVRRAVHTLKGNAASYGLDAVVATAHTVEAKPEIDAADLDQLERELRLFLSKNYAVLELDYKSERQDTFEVTQASVDALLSLLHSKPAELNDVKLWTAQLVLKRADVLLGPVHALIGKLCERLEKQVEFHLVGGEVMMDPNPVGPIFRNLTHLLRNAVDHGIEPAHERGQKSQAGRLELRVEETPVAWLITLADDGRGIDLERLAQKAVEKGAYSWAELSRMSEDELLELTFLDGVSTAQNASEISGRGVGMAAVRAAVRDAGGEIRLQSWRGLGTTVSIRIPKPDVLHNVGRRPSFFTPRQTLSVSSWPSLTSGRP